MSGTKSTIKYVLFDMDGLMIDSERVYTDVTNEILAPYGAVMTWDIKAGLMGKPEHAAALHLLSFFPDIPLTPTAYLEQRTALQDLRWPNVSLLPGVQKLVKHLYIHGIPMAIATGSVRRNYELKTAHLKDVFGLFGSNVLCADDPWAQNGARGKPFPDVFLAAARAIGRMVGEGEVDDTDVTDVERAERMCGLIFEDAIAGVQAGKRAGMNVVWIPDPNLLKLDAQSDAQKPDQLLRSLDEFKPEEWGLPPYDLVS
ncbi:HAD-like protein [Artomyces pyxidatus]|uniref:HAD-like protein n=1 Tax=Artomyces pyxidatus TaxID=48021 RepID=A0ACB8TFC7_9AGAM|nr:HAD-like protein [Artomyces pyxidatus]